MIKKILLCLATLSACISGSAAGMSAVLPVIEKAPVIDGKISPEEWSNAAEIYGLHGYNSAYLSSRQGKQFFAVDNNFFYFASQTELPPEDIPLLSRVKKYGGAVFLDDSVEITILPPHEKFVFQFIVNSLGTVFNRAYPVINGGVTATDSAHWTPQITVKNSIGNGVWTMEAKIPLRDLGINGQLVSGEVWKLLAGRSWHFPSEQTTLTKSFIFVNPDEMVPFTFDPASPVVSFSGIGNDCVNGNFDIVFEVRNPGNKARNIHCDITIVSDAAPRQLDNTVTLRPGEKIPVRLQFSEATAVIRDFKIIFTDKTSGKVLFRRNFLYDPALRKNCWINPKVKKDADLEFGIYPYFKLVRARYGNISEKINGFDSAVFAIKSADGKILKSAPGTKTAYGFEIQLPFDCPAGNYLISMTATGKDGKTISRERPFEIKNFPWEHNNIGCERIIVPPYKPLQKLSDNSVKATMTAYEFGNGFFTRISADDTNNILAAPITLYINGKAAGETAFNFTEVSNDRIDTAGEMSWDGGKIKLKGRMEYDGFYRFTMQFIPEGKQKIDSAYIAIPLKKEFATQIHSLCNRMKYNDAKFLPEGNGIIWRSSQSAKTPQLHGNFRPYVWLGTLAKGLVWICESDRFWSLDTKLDALDILAENDRHILRIHLVNKPTSWENSFTIEQAFQATPVRPMPEYRRKLTCRTHFPNSWKYSTYMGAYCWSGFGAFYPPNSDYSFVNYLRDKNFSPAADRKFIDDFIDRNLANIPTPQKQSFDRHMVRGIAYAKNVKYMVPYFNARSTSLKWPEYSTYMDEWWCADYRAANADQYNSTLTRSYQDMLLYYLQRLLREGMDGVYYDNIRDWSNPNPVTGPAYQLPNGNMQPYFDLFALREFAKRTAVLLCQEKKVFPDGRPVVTMHMTNTNVVPVLAFGGVSLDLEAEYGSKDFQDRFSEGYLQSCTLGLQSGIIPEVLISISGKKTDFTTRTFLAVTLAYDIPMVMNVGGLTSTWTNTWKSLYSWGYSTDEVKVTPCWENNQVTTGCKNWRICTYSKEKSKELVVAVCSFGENATAEVDAGKFAPVSCSDWESGKDIPVKDGKISLTIPKHDFRIVKFKLK
ncbi:MAG: hypothetical protein IKD23_07800 [Lentisphaeria bacterium]|nr:hypothetical protein [Lentisphaeria bacterium]